MLSVTQAPDGSLVDTRYLVNSIFVHKPIENPTEKVVVYGVLPRRGSQVGGYNLSIYGVNFHKGNPSVFYHDCLQYSWRSRNSGHCC
jgi:hypothetical protein